MDLKKILFILFRYKLGIAALIIASLLVSGLITSLQSPKYEASAQVLVKQGREISAPSQDIIEGGGFVLQKRREDIYAEVEIIQSRYIAEEVVRELGHKEILRRGKRTDDEPAALARWLGSWLSSEESRDEHGLSPFERAVEKLEANTNIETVIKSDTIRLHYTDEDEERAEQILDTLLARYLDRHTEVHKSAGIRSVFEPKVEHYKARLKETEEQIAVLKKNSDHFSLEAQRAALITQDATFRTELADTRRELALKKAKVARLEAQMASGSGLMELPDPEDDSRVIDSLRERIFELELDRERLQQEQSSRFREVTLMNAEVDKARRLLQQEHQRILTTNQADAADLKLRAATLLSDIEECAIQLQHLNVAEMQKIKLERDRMINERSYLRYTRELEDARISNAMDVASITNVRVIQPVVVSNRPVGPRRSLIVLLTAILSIPLSFGIAFLLHHVDHSIKTAADIEERLELPVLGSIAEARR